jgi:predicted SprT family Zn-dependent metalloprotease
LNLQEALVIAERLLNEHISSYKGWSVGYFTNEHDVITNRVFRHGKKEYRTAACVNPSEKKLYLNKSAVSAYSEEKLIDTIKHEIAHILVDIHHGETERWEAHGQIWQRYAIELGVDLTNLPVWLKYDAESRARGWSRHLAKEARRERKRQQRIEDEWIKNKVVKHLL